VECTRPWYTVAVRDVDVLRQRLLAGVGPDGGWPYYPGHAARVEPTAWALLALGATGHGSAERETGLGFLESLRRQSGLLVDPGAPAANAAWSGLAAIAAGAAGDARGRAFAASIREALATLKGQPLRPDPTVRQDNGLQAWPWIDGTFSWVEPTALCTLALKQGTGQETLGAHDRIAEADRLLLDRACRPAGWNYGNSAVLGQELHPYVPTTALALLALQDRGDEPVVGRSLEWLAANALSERSAMAIGLAAVCLTVLSRPTDNLLEELITLEARTGFLGNLHLTAIALFALTLPAHRATAFRI